MGSDNKTKLVGGSVGGLFSALSRHDRPLPCAVLSSWLNQPANINSGCGCRLHDRALVLAATTYRLAQAVLQDLGSEPPYFATAPQHKPWMLRLKPEPLKIQGSQLEWTGRTAEFVPLSRLSEQMRCLDQPFIMNLLNWAPPIIWKHPKTEKLIVVGNHASSWIASLRSDLGPIYVRQAKKTRNALFQATADVAKYSAVSLRGIVEAHQLQIATAKPCTANGDYSIRIATMLSGLSYSRCANLRSRLICK